MTQNIIFEEVLDKTFADIARQGYCLWKCEMFKGGIIAVVQDKRAFEGQMKFSDPRRVAAQYPVFTVAELDYLADKTDWTQLMVREAKSLDRCWIDFGEEG